MISKTFLIKAFLTLLLLGVLLARVDFSAILARLAVLSVVAVLAGIAISLTQNLALAGRWVRVTDFIGGTLPLGSAIQCTLISQLISQGLPASIGGDALRLWWLTRSGTPAQGAVLSVLLDRIAGFFALVVLCCLSAALLVLFVTKVENVGIVAAVVGFGFFGCIFGASRYARRVALVCWKSLPSTFRRRPIAATLMRIFIRFQRGASRLVLSVEGTKVLVWSLGIHLSTVLLCYIIVLGAGIPVSFPQLVATVPLVMLLSYLPISIGGWGVREGSMALALGVLGVPATDGVFVGLVLGAFGLCAALVGGVVWLLAPSPFAAAAPKIPSVTSAQGS